MALKAGWEYNAGADPNDPNALVRNTTTGQMLTASHPGYLNAPDAPAAAPPPTGTPAAPTAPMTAGDVQNKPATVGATTAQGAPTTVAQSFQQALVNRLNPTPVGVNSPEVAPAIAADHLTEQRGMERNQALLAQRAAANGQDMSGGFETNLLGLAQDRAGREGTFAGNAVQQANQIQNENMTSATGQIGNLLTGNANRDVQSSQFGQDLNLRNAALQQSGALGQGDLALRSQLGQGQLNLGLLSALMSGDYNNRALAQNGAQFGAGLDQSGLLALLGGL